MAVTTRNWSPADRDLGARLRVGPKRPAPYSPEFGSKRAEIYMGESSFEKARRLLNSKRRRP